MPERAVRLRVRGLVQGVGFRWSLCREAQGLGLRGWVRNRSDGSVEALAAGPAPAVQVLIDWARAGPPAARVERVDVQEADAAQLSGLPAGFDRRETL